MDDIPINATISWSFEEGDEAELAREMENVYGGKKKWWQFWK